ncbi:MAG: HAD hydrolase family protein [Chthoniobacterales bacterium]
MSRSIQLLSTDFDGTLIGHPSDGRCSGRFANVLMEHKARKGIWTINTGRSFLHTLEGVEHFQAPVAPDFLVSLEREIYCRDENGSWQAHQEWNSNCQKQHHILFESVRPLMAILTDYIRASPDVTLIEEKHQPVGLVTTSEDVMNRVVSVITEHSREYPDFSYQRNTIYLRFCHRAYHKGSALEEIARLTDISPSQILAAGDNHNDLAMLDGKYAHMACCPSNSIEEVKQVVRDAGGYIASAKCADGIAEAYHWFTEHSVEMSEQTPR